MYKLFKRSHIPGILEVQMSGACDPGIARDHNEDAIAIQEDDGRGYYVAIVCGRQENLPAAFAELDFAERQRILATPHSRPKAMAEEPRAEFASLPHGDRRIVRSEPFRKRIEAAARSRAPRRAAAV